jgi:hypothetical protein
MKGEVPMTLQDLAVTMGLFIMAVFVLVALGTIAFVKWDRREKQRRQRQIERARGQADLQEADGSGPP